MKHCIHLFFIFLAIFSSISSAFQPAHPPPQSGPYTHQVMSASSIDGLNWILDNRVLLEHASVPAAIVTKEGRIRIYYVDATQRPETINCAESYDGGLTFKVLGCTIAKRSLDKAVDPSIVQLPDGRYRLYYFCSERRIEMGKNHSIYSAISQDGIHFTQEAEVFNYPDAVDPDVFYNGKEWVMYVFGRGNTIIATSPDGLHFSFYGNMSPNHWGTTAPIKLSDGQFRLYAFKQRSAESYVGSFLSKDGFTWTQEPGVRLRAPEGKEITDPFVIRLPDGSWKMIFKISNKNFLNNKIKVLHHKQTIRK